MLSSINRQQETMSKRQSIRKADVCTEGTARSMDEDCHDKVPDRKEADPHTTATLHTTAIISTQAPNMSIAVSEAVARTGSNQLTC
jgi:hypothetical protein